MRFSFCLLHYNMTFHQKYVGIDSLKNNYLKKTFEFREDIRGDNV